MGMLLGWAGQRPASPPLVKQSPWTWGSWGIMGGVSASGQCETGPGPSWKVREHQRTNQVGEVE